MSINLKESKSSISCDFNKRDNNLLNSQLLQMEFENQIQELHRKLQIAREERKRSEMDAKFLEHRVMLLLNQEKLARRKYENTKNKLEDLYLKRRLISENHSMKKLHKENIDKENQTIKDKIKLKRENFKSVRSSSQVSYKRPASCVNFV